MKLHREGRWLIPLSLAVLALLCALFWWASARLGLPALAWLWGAAALVLAVLVVRFFRVPPVQVPATPGVLVAPANGKVVVLEEVSAPAPLQGRCWQLSIFMSPLDVHVNRAPADGQVLHVEHRPGKYLVAWHPKSSSLNEQTWVVLQTPHGPVGLRQIAGAVARRICCYVRPGDALQRGQEFGFIRFGSRVDVLAPLHFRPMLQPGQRCVGGETVLFVLDPNDR